MRAHNVHTYTHAKQCMSNMSIGNCLITLSVIIACTMLSIALRHLSLAKVPYLDSQTCSTVKGKTKNDHAQSLFISPKRSIY